MIRQFSTLVGLAAVALAASAGASVVVDTFQTMQTVQLPQGGSSTAFGASAAAEAIGGERDVLITRTAGNDELDALVNPSGTDELLSLTSQPSTAGTWTIVWDGPDGSPDVVADGLGGVDLTQAGANTGFGIAISSDLSATVQITVTGATGGSTSASLPLAGGDTGLVNRFLPFTEFSTQAPLSDAGSVALAYVGLPGADVLVDNVLVTAPEPAGAAAAAVTLLAIACRRRPNRKRA